MVFDWYWANDGRVMLDHALAAYFRALKELSCLCLVVGEPWRMCRPARNNFGPMISWWVKYRCAKRVLCVMANRWCSFIPSQDLAARAKVFGTTTQQLLAGAQRARDAGLSGFYFVAG